jgi:hypothetical protein
MQDAMVQSLPSCSEAFDGNPLAIRFENRIALHRSQGEVPQTIRQIAEKLSLDAHEKGIKNAKSNQMDGCSRNLMGIE